MTPTSRYLLSLTIKVLDEAVRNPIPGGSLTSRGPKYRVVTKMGGSVDHWHGSLVAVYIIPFTECIYNVKLDVRESNQCYVDQAYQLIHPTDIFAHHAYTLPVLRHVLVQVRLYLVKI